MPSTFQALAVALLALLPGALYELAREQRAGRRGLRGTDQIFRLLGFSVCFQVLISPLTYWPYSHYVVSHRVSRGDPVSCWVWAAAIGYLAVPFALGRFTAWGSRNRDLVSRRQSAGRWRRAVNKASAATVRLYADVAPAPRAWDYLWSRPKMTGWVVLHLKDGGVIAGAWNGSYAAGYPEPADLYLAEQVDVSEDGTILTEIDADTGEQYPILLGRSLLVRWEEIRCLDFYDATITSDDSDVSTPAEGDRHADS